MYCTTIRFLVLLDELMSDNCSRNENVETYNRAACLFKLLITIKHGMLYVADEFFLVKDINDLNFSLCIAWR